MAVRKATPPARKATAKGPAKLSKAPVRRKAPSRSAPAPRKSAARGVGAAAASPAPRREPRNDGGADGAALVNQRIRDAGGWKAATLERVRRLILEADPDMEEDVKWRKPSNAMAGVCVWSHGGLVCTGEPYKAYVKLTFARGAALPDPMGLFNAGFGGGTRRAIDLREGDGVDPDAFRALIKAAVALNTGAGEP